MKTQPYTGELNHRIVIQYETKTRSSTGEEKASFTDLFAVWAKLSGESSNEDVDGKVRQLIDNKYIIRYRDAVLDKTKTFYVVDGLNKYRVHYVKELQKNAWLELLVTAYE